MTRHRLVVTVALLLGLIGSCSACGKGSASSSTSTSTTRATTPTTSTTGPGSNEPDGPKGPWRLIFSDHFAGDSLNAANWSTCYHWSCTNKGNLELEWYLPSQVAVHNGAAFLTVIPDKTHGKSYASGMLSSYGKFSYRYGYAQIVAKLPRGQGLWSAFWTLPESGGWPPEIDILENWAQSDQVDLYVHFGHANDFVYSTVLLPNASTAFNTFGVDWEPGSISWYVDGFLWAHYAVTITQPEYLLVTLAVSGRIPPNSTVHFPQSLVIRSIQVWQHP